VPGCRVFDDGDQGRTAVTAGSGRHRAGPMDVHSVMGSSAPLPPHSSEIRHRATSGRVSRPVASEASRLKASSTSGSCGLFPRPVLRRGRLTAPVCSSQSREPIGQSGSMLVSSTAGLGMPPSSDFAEGHVSRRPRRTCGSRQSGSSPGPGPQFAPEVKGLCPKRAGSEGGHPPPESKDGPHD
jgi:hypothetical protein